MTDSSKTSDIRFLVTPGLRIVLLFLTWIVGCILMLFVSFVLSRLLDGNYVGFLRVTTVFQDVVMWVVPAVVTAMIATRQPARLLAVDTLPSARQVILGILLLIVSTPLMSWVIKMNAEFHLPESMASLEEALRAMEDNASHTVEAMLGADTPAGLIVNILIIGVLAGFSEELFFRGSLQRILATANLSPHAAIWISAFVFSALHLQFFGFIPRVLLGAAFGYLLWWSGSVWLPVIVHTLNNTLYVILYSVTGSGEPDLGSAGVSWVGVVISIAFTAATLFTLSRSGKREIKTL